MATIKGQNLRILVEHEGEYKCLAASTSAQLHIGVNVEESSTNDTDSNWQDNDVTARNWDLSSETLVVTGIREAGAYKRTTKAIVKDGSNDVFYDPAVSVAMKAGEKITIYTPGISGYGICLLNQARSTVLSSGATGQSIINYTAQRDETVVPAFSGDHITETAYAVFTPAEADAVNTIDLLSMVGQKVNVKMAVTDPASAKNRTILTGSNAFEVGGEAILSDISINSANRQRPTCSIQLQGVGEIS